MGIINYYKQWLFGRNCVDQINNREENVCACRFDERWLQHCGDFSGF
jgi:hypothetical protein